MRYGVVLKDERRTSNVQHRMKKQTPNTEHSTAISVSLKPYGLDAVLILVTKILINSSVSFKISSNSSHFLISGTF